MKIPFVMHLQLLVKMNPREKGFWRPHVEQVIYRPQGRPAALCGRLPVLKLRGFDDIPG